MSGQTAALYRPPPTRKAQKYGRRLLSQFLTHFAMWLRAQHAQDKKCNHVLRGETSSLRTEMGHSRLSQPVLPVIDVRTQPYCCVHPK
jgi:hypothetical protein